MPAAPGPPLQVEFNKAALSLADAFPADQKKAALNRLLKARRPLLAPVPLPAACLLPHSRAASCPLPRS